MIQVYKYKPYYEWKQELLWEYNDWYEDYLVFRITHNFDKQEILDKAKKQRELKNLEEKFNLHKKINAIWVALRKADSNNTKILLKAFDFYVKEYIEQFILPNQK